MERVTGIGGLCFRARDPKAPARWYDEHLGVTLTPANYDDDPWQQQAGPTALQPFPLTTEYFGNPATVWMVNFRERGVAPIRWTVEDCGSQPGGANGSPRDGLREVMAALDSSFHLGVFTPIGPICSPSVPVVQEQRREGEDYPQPSIVLQTSARVPF